MLHAGSLLSAFTSVPNPGRLCIVNPRCLLSSAAKGPAVSSHASDGTASGPAVRAAAAPQRAAAAASSASASAAHGSVVGSASVNTWALQDIQQASEEDVWHEKMRLAQEVLTLLRRILTDNVLGELSPLSGSSASHLLGQKHISPLAVFQMNCLRCICGYSLRDHVPHVDILTRCNTFVVESQLQDSGG